MIHPVLADDLVVKSVDNRWRARCGADCSPERTSTVLTPSQEGSGVQVLLP
jgi:hypothetical protein